MPGGKYFCVTLNHYSINDVNRFKLLIADPRVGYIIIGLEGADDTPHLQIYVEFNVRTTFAQAKRLLSDRIHIEARCSSATKAAEYCKKEGDFYEYGKISKVTSGARSDLDALFTDLRAGMTINEISVEHFGAFMRYNRSIVSFMNINASPRDFLSEVVCLWGKTGVGKTRSVWDFHDKNDIYVHPGGRWFDGYTGQTVALFDDFGGSEFKLSYLLKLLDRYPMRVPIKGSFAEWRPRTIYLTSNHAPCEWYPNAKPNHVEALMRRISRCVEMKMDE